MLIHGEGLQSRRARTEMYGSCGWALSLDPCIALHSEACCSWAAILGLGEEGLPGTLHSPLEQVPHAPHPGTSALAIAMDTGWLQCFALPGEGEARGEGDLVLGSPWLWFLLPWSGKGSSPSTKLRKDGSTHSAHPTNSATAWCHVPLSPARCN